MSRSDLTEQRQVDLFNAHHPVGTRVRYWSVVGDRCRCGTCPPQGQETTTRSEAFLLSGHTACVMLTGKSGCVALTHVEVIEETAHASS